MLARRISFSNIGRAISAYPQNASTNLFHTHHELRQKQQEGNPQVEVVIALGSNMGDRVANFDKALRFMRDSGISVISHGSLYESAPAYVTDQPRFLNSAVRATTSLPPVALLHVLKSIESQLGRTSSGIRYGPRPLDLDILFYGDTNMDDDNLTLPHPRIWERPFVLAPLMDLYNNNLTGSWLHRFNKARSSWEDLGGDKQLICDGLKRVMPIGDKLWDWSDRTYIMGILNLTPDSFSDGGMFVSVHDAVAQAEALASAGADFIDLGAQSTRPGATKLSSDEELDRLIPVLKAIKTLPCMKSVWISIDTFYSKVVKEAVKNGVHMVNDVSGGSLDKDMHATVGELGVPYVLMHMRGDPTTMQSKENLQYKNVAVDVAEEMCHQIAKAERAGIPAWRMVLDPGLGFAKNTDQNVELLGNIPALRSGLASWSFAASNSPILIGPSRKGFLGKICGRIVAADRDLATVGAAVAGVARGADIVRLHNVQTNVDALRVADAVFKRKHSLADS